eukprot:scaffold1506_cov179-Amphora_coffeaeformis.AAC.8
MLMRWIPWVSPHRKTGRSLIIHCATVRGGLPRETSHQLPLHRIEFMHLISSSGALLRPKHRWAWATALLPSVAGFHDLLPPPSEWNSPSKSTTTSLTKDLKPAGVSKIFFLRHGQTAKSETGVDFDRYLTDMGREQSRVAGASYGKNELLPLFPKVLVSPAPRTVETAELFLQAALGNDDPCSQNNIELVRIQDLYDKTMQPAGSKLFAKLGYAPLRDYVDSPDEQDRKVARDVLSKYAASAIDAIYREVVQHKSSEQVTSISSTLLIVAHAIYLPATALGVASSCFGTNEETLEVAFSTNTKEAEGYLIDLESNKIRYLTRPSQI